MLQQAISYRDRSGFVVVQDQSVHRYVSHNYAREYHHLMSSGLYKTLVSKGLLIPHTTKTVSEKDRLAYFEVLVPDFIPFISQPYEWTAEQWKTVVLALLEINKISMRYGMILKDATPFNFTFHRGSCVFIDTLSFDFYTEGPWDAYRQFCEMMLGPLALMHYNSISWVRLMMASINGWDLSFVHRNLGLRSYFNMNMLLHIHWHASYSDKPDKKNHHTKSASFSQQKLITLWDMLNKTVSHWKLVKTAKGWSSYYETDIESAEYLVHKTNLITQVLKQISGRCTIDLGSNTGKFALIASAYATHVIAVESDHHSVDRMIEAISQSKISNITTIVADITQPTPGVGWNNEERPPLLKRLRGDTVLALALIHHLCIAKNIPLEFVARLFHQMTDKYLVTEFVPKSDPKVQQMLANRKDIFDDYTEEAFIEKFGRFFSLEYSYTLDSSVRKLFVWIKK